jgi:cytochrome c
MFARPSWRAAAALVESPTCDVDVEPDSSSSPAAEPDCAQLSGVPVDVVDGHTEEHGQLTRVHQRELLPLATEQLNCAACHGFYVFGAQHDPTQN